MSDEVAFTAADLEFISDRDHVRERYSMYIGDNTSHGLHHLAFEIVDNSVQEFLAGCAHNIHVTMNGDGSLAVEDDGSGISVKPYRSLSEALGREITTLEAAMTMLKFGGKPARFPAKTSGGFRGIGATVVNFLSEWCEVETRCDGVGYRQRYERGIPQTAVETIGPTAVRGTRTTFKPDGEIFPDPNFSYDALRKRLQELAFLNPGLRIFLKEDSTKRQSEFCYPHGVAEFVQHLTRDSKPTGETIYVGGEHDGVAYEMAFQFCLGAPENVRSFVNNIEMLDGGTHVTGFRTALAMTLNHVGKKMGLLKDINPASDDVRPGLTGIIALRMRYPEYENATTTELGNREVGPIVAAALTQPLTTYFEQNAATTYAILNRAVLASSHRTRFFLTSSARQRARP